MEINTGIAATDRSAIADSLAQTLADTYALYQKTHSYHWNVEGPRFHSLHTLFQTQYTELWNALDVIAERIRALGVHVPTHSDLLARTVVNADNDPSPDADTMLRNLVTAHEAVVASARKTLRVAAEAGDESTADLMTARCTIGEKAAWMLRVQVA